MRKHAAQSDRSRCLGDERMPGPVPDAAQRLLAAQAGSREALGDALEACRGYLLLIAQQELEPELQAKGGTCVRGYCRADAAIAERRPQTVGARHRAVAARTGCGAMSAEPDPSLEEEFTSRLLAADEALAAGATPDVDRAEASPELHTRLE